MPENRDTIFICYAHEDEAEAAAFHDLLAPNARVFRDVERLQGGDDWDRTIVNEIGRSQIGLILVSPDFQKSDYIRQTELPRLLRARKENGLTLTWVEVRATNLEADHPLQHLQALRLTGQRNIGHRHGEDREAERQKVSRKILALYKAEEAAADAEFFNHVREAAGRRFGYRLSRQIAFGDNSVVYLADEPGRRLCVKARVTNVLDDDIRSRLKRSEHLLKRVKSLKHKSFLKLRDWDVTGSPQLLVCDYLRGGRPLSKMLEDRRREGKHMGAHQVRYVIQRLAEALGEYHDLCTDDEEDVHAYGNIRPSDVLITIPTADEWQPHISAFRASQLALVQEAGRRRHLLHPERMNYITPEQYAPSDTDLPVISPASDQYALGLLAIEMLQCAPPVDVHNLVDLEEKRRFFDDPVGFGGAWVDRAPELVETIARMLAYDPAARFASMAEVAAAFGTQDTVRENMRAFAKRSYQALNAQGDAFYPAFYAQLLKDRSRFKAVFEERLQGPKTWERQHRMLEQAICSLLNFDTALAVEPTILTGTASEHRGMGLRPEDFETFREAFLDTLRRPEFGQNGEETIEAWDAILAPGILYMAANATDP